MMTQKSTSQRKGRKDSEKRRDSKKLRKQEERLQERLLKARTEQTQAQERLERAEARLQKRIAQVQSLEESLAQVHERLEIGGETVPDLAGQPEPSGTSPDKEPLSTPSAENPPDDSSILIIPPLSAQNSENVLIVEDVETVEITPASLGSQSSSETAERAWQARAVAEAAEEEARAAVERMQEVSQRLEEGGVSGRHLEQELAELDAEIERANLLADEARRAAQKAEHESGNLKKLDEGPLVQEDEVKGSGALTAWQEKVWGVEEITEEEEQLEAGVARTLAEAAAQAAAEAEALAEASSARTRKARIIARQADQELTLLRASIRNGSLTGKEAEVALQTAENKSTYAHAELADAEAAEESAIDAARNAEAGAEVAEGMALSASDRCLDDVNGQAVQAIADQEEQQKGISTQHSDEEEENERTEERPAIRPQGSA